MLVGCFMLRPSSLLYVAFKNEKKVVELYRNDSNRRRRQEEKKNERKNLSNRNEERKKWQQKHIHNVVVVVVRIKRKTIQNEPHTHTPM